LRQVPDCAPRSTLDSLSRRSRVMPPGADLGPFVSGQKKVRPPDGPLTILWNHRWEDDKNPNDFFRLLFLLAEEGYPFRLSVVGETLRKWPPVFQQARKRLGNRMVQFGYLPKRDDYIETVRQADVVVSTAVREFFSLSVVEATAAGLYPLLPNRLSFPEIIQSRWHREFLYRDDRGLRSRLVRLLEGKVDWVPARQLSRQIQACDWHNRIRKYDDALALVAQSSRV
ncbi:unnamed protein product, partial [marine sediment metagenome]